MLLSKAKGNMSEYEEQMLINTVSELKIELFHHKPTQDKSNFKITGQKNIKMEQE